MKSSTLSMNTVRRNRRRWASALLAVATMVVALRGTAPISAPAAAPVSTASGTATATDKATPTATTTDPAVKNGKNLRPIAGFTPEREAAALTFVRSNHPELADLLDRLKVRQPHEYQKAVRDLFRVSERLASSREENGLRYELELKQWKLTSRIQVLSARISMGRTPEQEQELKHLLTEQLEAHRELITFNLERAKVRVAAMSRELQNLETNKQSLLDEKFAKAISGAEQRRAAQPKAAKSSATADKKSDAGNSEVKSDK